VLKKFQSYGAGFIEIGVIFVIENSINWLKNVHTLQITLQYVLIIHWNFFVDFLEKYNNHGFGLQTLF
jgi:hypothetical protein